MFSQSTHVVSRLIQVAKERSPVDNIDAFIQRFNETEFGYQLSLNMFRWQARPAQPLANYQIFRLRIFRD